MSNTPQKATGESGPIPLFAEGSDDSPFSAARMNGLVRPLNALLGLKVKRGKRDALYVADSNVILELARDQAGESAPAGSSLTVYKVSSIANIASDYLAAQPVTFDAANAQTLGAAVNVALPWALRAARTGTVFPVYAVNDYILVTTCENGTGILVAAAQLTLQDIGIGRQTEGVYRGLHATGVKYALGDFVHTIAGSALVTLLWACTQAHTTQTPSPSATTYWRLVGVSGDFRRFTLNSGQTNNDYLVCNEQAGVVTNVSIYKPRKLRYITTETLGGDTVSYTAYDTDKFGRTATVGSESEKQVIIPYFLTGDSIMAQYDPLANQWVDLNVDGRAWARKYVQ